MEVAEGSEKQSRAAHDTTNVVEQMSADILQRSTRASTVVTVANQSAETASGSKAVEAAIQQNGKN